MHVAEAASSTIQDAQAAASAACLVFAHSMLDGAIDDYCRVSTLLSPSDWKDFVEQETITLAEAKESTFDDLLRKTVADYLKKFRKNSLPNKIEAL